MIILAGNIFFEIIRRQTPDILKKVQDNKWLAAGTVWFITKNL